MNSFSAVSTTQIDGLVHLHSGKVRDVYEIDDKSLLLVATDRISAFDCILPTPIPLKGKVLTQISAFWFARLGDVTPNHLITSEFQEMPDIVRRNEELRGRSMLVKRTTVFPVECVVRGYLEGSGWKDYQANGSICGHLLPVGLRQCDRLPEPLFTPATKAATGHDENIDYARFGEIVGVATAGLLRDISLKLYANACEHAITKGIIIADTKFEFGMDAYGDILLIDELLTPDSSRFWAADTYNPGAPQASFDKQFVREYLETLDWDKRPPAPPLPNEIAKATTDRYVKSLELLSDQTVI